MPANMRTLLLLVALGGCASSVPGAEDGQTPPSSGADGDPDEPVQPKPSASVTPAKPGAPLPFGKLEAKALPKTEDGIPILTVSTKAAAKTGEVVWIPKDALALDSLPQLEASDGESSYLVVDKGSSILVRGSEVHEGILARFGVESGGCGGMRHGEIVLSGIITSNRDENVVRIDGNGNRTNTTQKKKVQITVSIDRDGRETIRELPDTIGTEDDCRVWVGDKGEFLLAASSFVLFDGTKFAKLDGPGLGWAPSRTTIGSVHGKRFCFRFCNDTEEKETDALTLPLREALGVRYGGNDEWAALEGWIAGVAATKAVRANKDGKISTLDGVPSSSMLNGSQDIALLPDGGVVIGLAYRFREYVVWKAGERTATPVRKLDAGDVIANASPTVLVRGLGNPIPEAKASAVLLGKSIGMGVGGSTYGYSAMQSSKAAHAARFARAKAVLGKGGKLVGAHEAVVDLACGAFVRSPLGWEDVGVKDWIPPKLPALHAKAVTKPAKCTPLDEVSAVPGVPDLLLARSGKKLLAAWLPPPLPLPRGEDPRREFMPPTKAPKPEKQRPRPGVTWFEVGTADDVQGDDGIVDPGGDTRIAHGSWQSAGAAIVEVDGAEILFLRNGAVTLPKGTTPMAVSHGEALRVWGARGHELVECTSTCRVLDPGVKDDIVAVVPRNDTTVVLGFADGRMGVYTPPATGGTAVKQHDLAAALAGALARAPVE
jgi:hypothetical protein